MKLFKKNVVLILLQINKKNREKNRKTNESRVFDQE
jgi:hypothetical protein